MLSGGSRLASAVDLCSGDIGFPSGSLLSLVLSIGGSILTAGVNSPAVVMYDGGMAVLFWPFAPS
jgi:hypothetical protein